MDKKLARITSITLGWVALGGAFLWVVRDTNARANVQAEAAAEAKAKRAEVFRACEEQIRLAVTDRLATLPRSPQKACREWMEQLVRGSMLNKCLYNAGAVDVFAFQSDCWPLRQMQQYCAPADWPPDAFDPGLRSACKLS